MPSFARLDVQIPAGAHVILIGSSHLSRSECVQIETEIGNLKPASVGLGIDRNEARSRFPSDWMKFRPPPLPQLLRTTWPGLGPFISSLLNNSFNQHVAHLRVNWGDGYAAAVSAATQHGAQLCTVGHQGSMRATQSQHILPLWLRLMLAESSPASLYWAAATGDRGAIASIASSAVYTVADFWRPVVAEQELKEMQATLTDFIKLYRTGLSNVDPFMLVNLYRRAGRSFLTARDAAARAPPSLILGEQASTTEATAVAFNVQEMCGSTRVVVLPHYLLLPVKHQLEQSPAVSIQAATRANEPPPDHRMKHAILPTALGAFLIGSFGAALAGRRHSARARAFLKLAGFGTAFVSVAGIVPLVSILRLPSEIGRAVQLGGVLQHHEEVLSAATLAYKHGSVDELAKVYAASAQLSRSLRGRGSAADDRTVMKLRASQEHTYAQERH